ncbi:MAG: SDR family NAD(P)-dependent oxidoreductase, partial [Armatimonadetes bacterium]|nr:SDR family NAD(P)-dependent oxidoreductase [Armatimonadota bacterium]
MIDYGLAGRVAIVTGASRGIGKAVARALAGAGARVGICARNPEELEASRRELAAVGAVVAVPCDVRSRESVDA